MAATGYTPIQIYYSSTTTNTPAAGNLAYGELAINITDGKLFYKDNANAVQVLATKGAGTIRDRVLLVEVTRKSSTTAVALWPDRQTLRLMEPLLLPILST